MATTSATTPSGDILDAKADDVEGAYNLVALKNSRRAAMEDGYDSQATIDEQTGKPVEKGSARRRTNRKVRGQKSRKSKRQSRGRRTAGRRKASRGRR
jgi:hypothetical protein